MKCPFCGGQINAAGFCETIDCLNERSNVEAAQRAAAIPSLKVSIDHGAAIQTKLDRIIELLERIACQQRGP